MSAGRDKGTFRQYRRKSFRAETLALIKQVNLIIDDLESQGFVLSLRQLYYQLVTKNLVENTQESYNRVQRIVSDARLAGLVSWTSLEDRGRNLRGYRTHDTPGDAVRAAAAGYKIDLWATQEWRPEVWVEKQAMESVVGTIAGKLRVNYYATKGYDSQSQQWRAGQRFADYIRRGQRPIVFHIADHDPSGIDMTNDVRDRLTMFTGSPVIVQRLALTMAQVEQYNPPPNPAKETDARFEQYRQQFGDSSWELDALSPQVIMDLIRDAIAPIRDEKLWSEAVEQETTDLRVLEQVVSELGRAPANTDPNDEE